MTLDVIGLAAFNYEFNALEPRGGPSEVHEAFTHLLHSPHAAQRQVIVRLARALIPILRYLPLPGSKDLVRTRTKMLKIARQLFVQSKATAMASGGEKTTTDRDLLSLMVNANLSTDLSEDQRLSDDDVIARPSITVTVHAGHETTSATAWALYALSLDIRVQTKLREELLSLPNDNPTMDELNSLPYLESVGKSFFRESMRVHTPVEFTVRVAMEDDVIPLSKPYVDRHGRLYNSISIRKGTMIRIPISAVHHDKEIWGDDASEFRPERWEHTPDAVNAVPGVWGNLLTFLGGSHHCIGFRFAVVEMKALLFTLIRAFEFGAVVSEGDLGYTSTPAKRPLLGSFDKLVIQEVPVHAPKATEVLVKTHAVSLQFRDLGVASGHYPGNLPPNLVPCSDMAGEIIAVGEDVKEWKVGDRICASFFQDKIHNDSPGEEGLGGAVHGVLTQYRTFPAQSIVAIPDHLSYEEASTLPCAALAAYNALLSGYEPVKAGDTVLVQGTGGVSIFALQFAIASGATVIVTSSSDEKLKAVKKLGAKHVINYKTTPNWAEEVVKLTNGVGVDRVIEVTGNATLNQSFASVRKGGSIDMVGHLGGIADVPPVDIVVPCIMKLINIRGINVGSVVQLKNMNKLIAANVETTRPIIDKVFSFADAKAAYAHLASQTHVGKVVIKI
ncbi:Alcohol dehydrogenase superfamily protein [Mycena venus]|uniref:Alcohol dehydrogenase superfamily protein n=1 Tax=Mycena venus TaxID=2733690 RepID=A0A8H6YCQ7_9AGAR|nr:Alcohol dehydrogenase superfamily protein [Mycena venus]